MMQSSFNRRLKVLTENVFLHQLTFCCYISQIQVTKVFQAVQSAAIKNVAEPQEILIKDLDNTLSINFND